MVFDPRDPASPCYACMFTPEAEFEEVQCSTMGVFARWSVSSAPCRQPKP